MQKKIFIMLVSVIVLTAVFLGGCANRTNTNQQASVLVDLETCAELNGYICNESEECNGSWLDAVDSFRCCSCECSLAGSEDEILLPDIFDETPENEDLGGVSP